MEVSLSWLYLLSHCRTLKCIDDNPSLCSSWRLGWIPMSVIKIACFVYVNMDWWWILFVFRAACSFSFPSRLLLEAFPSSVIVITVHIFKKKKRKAWQCCWMSRFCVLVNSVIDQCVSVWACVWAWSQNCWIFLSPPVAYLCCCLLQTWRRWPRCH